MLNRKLSSSLVRAESRLASKDVSPRGIKLKEKLLNNNIETHSKNQKGSRIVSQSSSPKHIRNESHKTSKLMPQVPLLSKDLSMRVEND